MGVLFSNCAAMWAKSKDRRQQRRAQSRGRQCIVVLREAQTHLNAMQAKYQTKLQELEDAMEVAAGMPKSSAHEQQLRKNRLTELIRKRNAYRHYLSVCSKRNNQLLCKTLAIEQLELNAMQLSAIRSTSAAMQSFSNKGGDLESIEDASDALADHMEQLTDIEGIIGESLPLGFDDDDDALQAELASFDRDLPPESPPVAVMQVKAEELRLPAAPTHNPAHLPASAETPDTVAAAVGTAAAGAQGGAVALAL